MAFYTGTRDQIGAVKGYYDNRAQIEFLKKMINEVRALHNLTQSQAYGLSGPAIEASPDGSYFIEKPDNLNCGSVADDLGCQTVEERPETVPEPDPAP